MKFGQVIEQNKRNIFLQKLYRKVLKMLFLIYLKNVSFISFISSDLFICCFFLNFVFKGDRNNFPKNITIWWNITLYKKVFNCMFLSFHVRVLEWIHTLQLPECQGTPYSKQAQNLKFEWLQWLSVRLRTKWLWVRVSLESLKKILLNPKKAGKNGFSWL